MTTYTWQQAVQDAIGESDVNQLERKIRLVEIAIFERIDTFFPADDREDVAFFEALCKLRALRELLENRFQSLVESISSISAILTTPRRETFFSIIN